MSRDVAVSLSPHRPLNRPNLTRILGVVGATAAASAVWLVAVSALGVHLLIRFGSGPMQSVGLGSVVAASVVGALVGWGLLVALERRTPDARTLWTWTASIVLLVSLALPMSVATTLAGRVTLSLMHLAVAGVLIPTLRRRRSASVGFAA
jgi:hypothetical protein